ncbi:hypothetical protein SAMN04487934_102257 [Eubacterium ruminantium]|nr:hypothetical protein SAMN04487934_102257 [Eubacterium ruminantium]
MKSFKKLLAAFLVVFVTLGFAGKAEAGSIADAKEISFNKTYSKNLGANDPDFYKFRLPKSGYITVNFEGSKKITAELYKEDMETRVGYWDAEYNENFGIYKRSFYAEPLYGGTYYLKFKSSYDTDLKFTAEYYNSGETFAETQTSHYDFIKDAKAVKQNKFYYGYLAGSGLEKCDDTDMYKFEVSQDATYSFFVRRWFDDWVYYGPTVDILRSSDGTSIFSDTPFYRTNSETKKYEVELTKGTYYFKVSGNTYCYKYGFQISMKKPVITTEVADQTTINGSVGKFTVKVDGANLKYQWYVSKDGKTWAKSSATGNKTDTLSIRATKSLNGRKFKCIITNDGGKVTSLVATWKILNIISEQPSNKTVKAGTKATFTVKARSRAAKYQWQVSTDGGETWKNSSATGAKTDTISFTAKKAQNGYMYRCVVKNGTATQNSSKAKLTVK